ncbi:MAG: hypothetical protein QOG04_2021 [Actinomycetota bacterium]|jgi:hypothetical protein|nr:hypothetical protein [Actinomycetota bacterium]
MAKVVITMPAYRAAQTVAKTVADVPAELSEHMILVDDASPDDTVELARELGLRVFVHTENKGYGANLKTCYLKALEGSADVVVVLHPDYQYDPKAVPLLIAPILAGDADMTFGSRFAGVGDPRSQGMPFYRFMGNRVTTVLQNAILGTRFTEMHSGMRAYTRDCILSLPFLGYSDDFAFESQILIDAVVRKHRVVEVPIPTRYTVESSSLNLKGLFKYVWETVAYTATRTRQWGRRGRRWPLARRTASTLADPVTPTASLPESVGLPDAAAGKVVESVLERLGSYLLPGTSVAVVAGSDELLAQLSRRSDWRHAADPDDVADACVILCPLSKPIDIAGVAASVRRSLHDEGMLALVLTESLMGSPHQLAEALWQRGFELVEWNRMGRLIPKATLVLARPVRAERGAGTLP